MTPVLDFMSKSTITAGLTSLGITLVGSFTDIEFPIFIALIIPTFILVYYSYYKNFLAVRKIGGTPSSPIGKLLKHAYFVDDVYYAIAKGLGKFSIGVKFIEDSAVQGVTILAYGALAAANKLKKVPSSTIQNYIAAGVVGFILIVVLLVLTIGV